MYSAGGVSDLCSGSVAPPLLASWTSSMVARLTTNTIRRTPPAFSTLHRRSPRGSDVPACISAHADLEFAERGPSRRRSLLETTGTRGWCDGEAHRRQVGTLATGHP